MNVIMIICDTLRQDHVGAYGNNWIKTPNLDAFARESIRFTRCYPESMPTLQFRRAIHTGNRVYPFTDFSPSPRVDPGPAPGWGSIPEDEDAISEILGVNGYRTAFITDCFHAQRATRNYQRGYDSYAFLRGQEVDRYNFAPPVPKDEIMKHLNDKAKGHENLKKLLNVYLRNAAERRSEEDYQSPQVFRTASKWLLNNYDAEKIFMMIDSFDPHEPWDPPLHYRKMYDPDEDTADLISSPYCPWADCMNERELKRLQANYAGKVSMVDRWFGYFMESLRVSGRLDDTLVVVMSDHGHNLGYDPKDKGFVGKHGHALTRSVADLVMMMRHPEGKRAGTVCDKLIYNIDITRTVLSLAGAKPNNEMDGMDVWPAVMDPSVTVRDYITMAWGSNITVIKDPWWYNANVFGKGQLLHNLEKDPDLTDNLADKHPEVCKELLALAIKDAGGSIPEERFRKFSQQPNSKLWRFHEDGDTYCSTLQVDFKN